MPLLTSFTGRQITSIPTRPLSPNFKSENAIRLTVEPTAGGNVQLGFSSISGNVRMIVDWGDGTVETVRTNNTSHISTHTYSSSGTYTALIYGDVGRFGVADANDIEGNQRDRITGCTSFGNITTLTSLENAFYGCANLVIAPPVLPNTVTSLKNTFTLAFRLNDSNVALWDTGNVTNMERTFLSCQTFNRSIGSWDTGNVTIMNSMFNGAQSFNQSLNSWNTSSVTSMDSMFSSATAFNQPLYSWDTSNVTNMVSMFLTASAFNGNINTWDTGSVNSFNSMFLNASAFNQNIGSWDTSSATNMSFMFFGATTFNQNLTGWCVTNIASEPSGFATSSALTSGNKPVWGTCP